MAELMYYRYHLLGVSSGHSCYFRFAGTPVEILCKGLFPIAFTDSVNSLFCYRSNAVACSRSCSLACSLNCAFAYLLLHQPSDHSDFGHVCQLTDLPTNSPTHCPSDHLPTPKSNVILDILFVLDAFLSS